MMLLALVLHLLPPSLVLGHSSSQRVVLLLEVTPQLLQLSVYGLDLSSALLNALFEPGLLMVMVRSTGQNGLQLFAQLPHLLLRLRALVHPLLAGLGEVPVDLLEVGIQLTSLGLQSLLGLRCLLLGRGHPLPPLGVSSLSTFVLPLHSSLQGVHLGLGLQDLFFPLLLVGRHSSYNLLGGLADPPLHLLGPAAGLRLALLPSISQHGQLTLQLLGPALQDLQAGSQLPLHSLLLGLSLRPGLLQSIITLTLPAVALFCSPLS
mmetsp:Transcript_2604/g.5846  ORF Transcript_2604/g.5846 Transcript_2604/m.5846 type:complete len:263 (+) Transcript_2604:1495-2283(+)